MRRERAEKVAPGFKSRRGLKRLVEKVFAPFLVAMTDQAHQLARSVKSERARAALKFQASFFRSAIAFTIVAPVAAGHQILPGGAAAARTRHHVVECQFRSRQSVATKLASVAVAQQNIFSRERPALLRDVAVSEKTNHGRHLHSFVRGMNFRVVGLFSLSHALQHQDQSAAHGGNVDGFEGGVEYENRRLHHGRTARWRGRQLGSGSARRYTAKPNLRSGP